MPEPLIELTSVSFTYPDGFQGIRDISLCINKGEFILLAGKNGSGKSTLLRHFNGLLLPDTGTILVNKKKVGDHLVDTRKTVGMVFQDADTQIVGDTVYDEVAFGLENLKLPRKRIKEKTEHVMERMDLLHLKDRNPWTLSGGEKRRLAVAGILVMDPSVIVFDEPFSNLDYPGAVKILETIVRLNQAGHTIIIATHDIEIVIAHATRMVIMADKEIHRDGRPSDLIHELESFGIRRPCSARLGMGILPWHD